MEANHGIHGIHGKGRNDTGLSVYPVIGCSVDGKLKPFSMQFRNDEAKEIRKTKSERELRRGDQVRESGGAGTQAE